MVLIGAESFGTMCRYCLQNPRNSWDIVRSGAELKKTCDIGNKKPVSWYIHIHIHMCM